MIVAEVGKEKNITVDDPSMWMYDKCLDVDECAHDVYDCDENASCVNTETSYICVCNKGFIQYGKECQKTYVLYQVNVICRHILFTTITHHRCFLSFF